METTFVLKQDGRYDISRLCQWFQNAADGNYRIEITKIRRKRTLDQNGWLFGCIYPLLMQALNNEGWEFVTVHQVHEFFKNLLGKQQFVNKHTGEVVELPQSTAEMDTVAFSTYCDKLRDYGREYLNIEIPDPDKLWNYRAI